MTKIIDSDVEQEANRLINTKSITYSCICSYTCAGFCFSTEICTSPGVSSLVWHRGLRVEYMTGVK